MRKVILQEFVSADGFAADKNGSTQFFEKLPKAAQKEIDRDMLQFFETIDTILLGANTYKMFTEFWPNVTTKEEIVADALNEKTKKIFSKSLDSVSWGKYDNAELIRSDASEAIRQLKQQTGKDMIIFGSLSLAQSLLKDGIIDTIRLHVCPVGLGAGRKFFPETVESQLMLKKNTSFHSGVVLLEYQPDSKQ